LSKKAEELATQLRQQFSGPMTEAEITFCQDMQAFLAFALRNGLSYAVVMSVLAQDINEIARDGFDLQRAQARGYLPKVTGYRQITEDDFGEHSTEDI
jgi:hypothetical protein